MKRSIQFVAAVGSAILVAGCRSDLPTSLDRTGSSRAGGRAQMAATAAAATITGPTPGSTLSGTTVVFSWTTGTGVSRYWLSVGTTVGGTDIYDLDQSTYHDATVSSLPKADGSIVYVRLKSLIDGTYQFNDYSYRAATGSKAVLTNIHTNDGDQIQNKFAFEWSAGTNADGYWLSIGTFRGGADIYDRDQGHYKSATVTLPSYTLVYVNLKTLLGNAYQNTDYTFLVGHGTDLNDMPARSGNECAPPSDMALIVAPSPWHNCGGGYLDYDQPNIVHDSTVVFSWTAGNQAENYWLSLGSTSGGTDLYDVDQKRNRQATVTLPADGRKIYVRLKTRRNGVYQYIDWVYRGPVGKAVMQSPAAGSVLSAKTVFSWSQADLNPTAPYRLSVGSAQGGTDIYDVSQGRYLNATVNLPSDGRRLFVRLWTYDKFNDYVYTAAPGSGTAILVSPTPSTTLHGPNATFRWSAGSCSQYWFTIGNSPGTREIANYNRGVDLAVDVAGMPTDGRTMYARIWCLLNGAWQFNDYTYAAGP